MGVHGLWKLLEPSGKPVTLESLDNKILAIDVSMWLHQVMKGYQDSTGNPLPNAHLLGLFHRICKLLFYRIRPVFVFDGGVPQLKQQTLASRRNQRSRASRQAEKDRLKLLRNLAEQNAVRQALGGAVSRPTVATAINKPSKFSDFILEPMPQLEGESSDESEDESFRKAESQINWDNFDPESVEFKRLTAQEKLEILTDLKEARKQSSWGHIHKMPQESGEFSGFQLKRLLLRRSAQVGLEQVEQELGQRHTLTMAQLEELMQERGSLAAALDNLHPESGHRIASDTSTRFLLVKNGQEKSSNETETLLEEADTEMDIADDSASYEKKIKKMEEQLRVMIQSLKKPAPKININQPSTSATGNFSPVSNEPALPAEIITLIGSIQVPQEDKSSKEPQIASNSKQGVKCVLDSDSNEVMGVAIHNPSNENSMDDFSQEMCDFESEMTDKVHDIPQNDLMFNENSDSDGFEEVIKTVAKFSTKTVKQFQNEIITLEPVAAETFPEVSKVETKSAINLEKSLNFTSSIEANGESVAQNVHQTEKPSLPSRTRLATQDSTTAGKRKSVCNEAEVVPVKKPNLSPDRASAESTSGSVKPLLEPAPPPELTSTPSTASSDSSDFEEVPEDELPAVDNLEEPETKFEIKITTKVNVELKDDIFADIFENSIDTKMNEEKECSSQTSLINTRATSPTTDGINEALEETKPVSEQTSVPTTEVVSSLPSRLVNQDLVQLEAELENEGRELAEEAGRQDRLATSISDQMCLEAQQLLRLFGLPYVTAPMEAEAQCATLDLLTLTHGTVTDDSDIWLFGGKTVYRNFFNHNRNVELYTADSIHRCFKLARQQLVLLAMLVGSDYTSGLSGVGPVTALEILAAFPTATPQQQADDLVSPLKKFREWWIKRESQSVSPKLKRLSTKLKDLNFSDGFPSEAVAEAYLHPTVDDSREVFSWGKPNIPALITFAKEKFGWNKQHCESILMPVVKRMHDISVQTRLDAYFALGPATTNVESKMSTRVREAVSQLGGDSETTEAPSASVADDDIPLEKPVRVPPRPRKAQQPQLSTLAAMRKELNKKPRGPKRPLSEVPKLVAKPNKTVEEKIPQREKDKETALQSKLKAIELFRKRKLDPTKRDIKTRRMTKDEHYLSESSDDD